MIIYEVDILFCVESVDQLDPPVKASTPIFVWQQIYFQIRF